MNQPLNKAGYFLGVGGIGGEVLLDSHDSLGSFKDGNGKNKQFVYCRCII